MSEDLRIIKTKLRIKDTLLKLIDEKGFTTITINDICQRALISRSTFYYHYDDKFDLIEQIIQELLQPLEDKFSQKYGKGFRQDQLRDFLDDIFLFYITNSSILQTLLKTPLENSKNFKQQFDQICQNYLHQLLEQNSSTQELPLELLTSLYASIVSSLMTWTIEHGHTKQLTDFAYDLHQGYLTIITSQKS